MAAKKPKPISSPFEKAQNRQYGKQGASLGGDVGRVFSDIGRNLGSLGNDIHGQTKKMADYWNGWDPVSQFISDHSGGAQVLSTARHTPKAPAVSKGTKAAAQGTDPAAEDPNAPVTAAKTLADYLAQARAMGLGGDSGANYDPLIAQLKTNANQGDAKLAAMYSQLQGNVAAQAPGIQKNFDTAGSKIAGNADQASADTAQAYNQTRQAQTAQLSALGIGDTAGVLAANGGQAARDQNIALGNIQQGKAADVNQNTAHGASAIQYNTGVGSAAQLAGGEARSALQQQLASKLAELESAKQSASTNGAQTAFNAALQLKSLDDSDSSNAYKASQQVQSDTLSNQYKAGQIALQQLKLSGGSSKTLSDALGGSVSSMNALQKIAAKAGVANDAKSFNQWLANLKLASQIGG